MMRADGRTPTQLRPVSIETGVLKFAEGSALIRLGDTRVLCAASVQPDVPPHRKGSGQGWVTAEYSLLPRSTKTRTIREAARGRLDGRTQEIQRLIGRSLRAVTDLAALGERTIIVDCDVLDADGGTRTAAITGGWVALALAVRKVGLPPGVLREPVAAVSVGLLDGTAVLDLPYEEDVRAGVDMNVVMTGSGTLVELQGTAEGAPFTETQLIQLLALARAGIADLVAAQRRAAG
jgi:ribonuclease PH